MEGGQGTKLSQSSLLFMHFMPASVEYFLIKKFSFAYSFSLFMIYYFPPISVLSSSPSSTSLSIHLIILADQHDNHNIRWDYKSHYLLRNCSFTASYRASKNRVLDVIKSVITMSEAWCFSILWRDAANSSCSVKRWVNK